MTSLKKIEDALKSYALLAAPAVMTSYLAGFKDPKTLAIVAGASIILPLSRALNPKDPAYGVVSIAAAELTKEAAALTATPKA